MANLEKGSTVGGVSIPTIFDLLKQNLIPIKGQSAYTQSNHVGHFFKMATITISSQYDRVFGTFDVMSGSGGASSYQYGKIIYRVKQQAALGSAPIVSLILKDPIGMTENDVVAVLSQNDSTKTVVDLYVKANISFDAVRYQTHILAFHKNITIYDYAYKGGAFVSSPPTGIQQFTCQLSGKYYGMTLYVKNSTGSDSNDGLTTSTPLKTVSKALSIIGKNVTDVTRIRILEDITQDINLTDIACPEIDYFIIEGHDGTNQVTRNCGKIFIKGCGRLQVYNVKPITSQSISVDIQQTQYVRLTNIDVTDATNGTTGISVTHGSKVLATSGISVSNKQNVFVVDSTSDLTAQLLTYTNNTNGFVVSNGAVAKHSASQSIASFNYVKSNGGVIFNSTGALV